MRSSDPDWPTAPSNREGAVVRAAVFAMGTRFEAVLAGGDESRLRSVAEAALAEITEWDQRLSLFRPDSLVSHLNRSAHERAIRVDGDTFELLSACREVWAASGGAFDITIGPLMRAWGFRGGPADPLAVEAARACIGMDAVELDASEQRVRFRRPGLALDMGAVGKGHALLHAAAVIREAGVESALLHGGTSSVVAIGSPPGGAGWRVGVAGTGITVTLHDQAMSVSAPRGRMVQTPQGRRGHILDPRTGAPAGGAGLTVVLGDCARLADAWSTALLVLKERPIGMPASLQCLIDPCSLAPSHNHTTASALLAGACSER